MSQTENVRTKIIFGDLNNIQNENITALLGNLRQQENNTVLLCRVCVIHASIVDFPSGGLGIVPLPIICPIPC